jgi:hypothetical protein
MRARARTKMGTTLGALTLLGGALVTSAGAGIGDSRSPDAIDAGIQAHAVVAAGQRSPHARAAVLVAGAGDRRSPDAMDAATRAHAVVVVDLRSPDARSAAFAAPTTAATSVALLVKDGGFNWTDAGIGATSGIALTLMLAGAFLLVRRNGRKLAI